MRSRLTKKRFFGALSTIAVLAAAGAAIAYFTTTGQGTGSAAVGTNAALTITGTATSSLYPGTSSPVTFTANNPSSGHQQIGTVTLTGIKACVGTGSSWNGTACSNGGTEATTCEDFTAGASNVTTKDFYMAPVVENQDLPSGNGTSLNTNGTLVMNNFTAASQDACKGANLYLTFSS
jgi:hypothetical protein